MMMEVIMNIINDVTQDCCGDWQSVFSKAVTGYGNSR